MEELGKMPYQIDPAYLGTRVVLLNRRNWFKVIFITLWLAGWFVGESIVIVALFRLGPLAQFAIPRTGQLFLGLWLCVWTIGGAGALVTLLGYLTGSEEIRIQNGVLEHFKGFGQLGKTWRYPLHEIKNLRADRLRPPVQGGFTRRKVSQDGLRFEFGGKPVEMGWGLNEAEARQLLSELQRRHTSLKEHS